METDRKEAKKKGNPFDEDLERYIKEIWIPEETEEKDRARETDGELKETLSQRFLKVKNDIDQRFPKFTGMQKGKNKARSTLPHP